jgi:nucleotide-binding universal stress UspA family protein
MQYTAENCFQTRVLAAPDHILVATDLTDSDYLIPHVIAQAKVGNARVTLFHAVPPVDSLPLESGAIPYIDQTKIDREVHLMLEGMAREIQAKGILCGTSVKHGYAGDAICAEICRTGAGRLIMGTHGRRKLAQMALGSVANELLARVEIPIFAVGPHARGESEHVIPQHEHAKPRMILHPVSFKGDYRRGVCLALDLAQTYRARLTLMHVLDSDVREEINPERTLSWAERALTALVPPAEELRFPVETRATSGELVEEVLRAAAATRADWIVLGVDPAAAYWKFRDSTAYKVLAGAKCPVLALRNEPCHKEAVRKEDHRIDGVIV